LVTGVFALGLIVVFLSALAASCDDDDGDIPQDAFVQQDAAIDAAVDASPDASGAPHITDSHTGWKDPSCMACHGFSTSYPHTTEGYTNPDCGACHGYNGAKHSDHAVVANPGDCADSGCHGMVPHVPTYIKAECEACHYHPSSPNGD